LKVGGLRTWLTIVEKDRLPLPPEWPLRKRDVLLPLEEMEKGE
jgi:hypothetical protein